MSDVIKTTINTADDYSIRTLYWGAAMVKGNIWDIERFVKNITEMKEENKELRKCKDALEAMLKCPLIQDAGFVPYIESVLGLRDDYVIRSGDE